MRTPKVAVYGGGGAPYHHLGLFSAAGYSVSVVFPVEVRPEVLASFDAFVIPGGGFRGMKGQIDALGRLGADALVGYVSDGGLYMGSCAGAYDVATPAPGFVLSCPLQKRISMSRARIWNEVAEPWSGLQSPGVGRIRVANRAPEHPVMRGLPLEFEIVHYNGPLFANADTLCEVRSTTPAFTPCEGFLATEWNSPTMMERAAQEGVAAVAVDYLGDGRLVLFGSHPEFGFGFTLDDEQVPAMMLRNAVQWQVEAGREPTPWNGTLRCEAPVLSDGLAESLEAELAQIELLTGKLSEMRVTSGWMDRRYAMSVFGVEPVVVWQASLDRLAGLCGEIRSLAGSIRPSLLGFRQPPDLDVDFGYHGVLALVEQCRRMLGRAVDQWDVVLGPPQADPYAFGRTGESPYQLVAASYLSAVGRLTGAAILCRSDAMDLNRPLH